MEYVTVAQEGFYGLYHVPVKDHDPKKVVIVVGGSEGNENIPMNVGAMFARCGIAALGICYWNVDGLPKELVRVPVDPFEKAILWLKNRGYEKYDRASEIWAGNPEPDSPPAVRVILHLRRTTETFR